MPEIVDWQSATDQRSLLERAATALTAGRLVVLPTDTGYRVLASALHSDAVLRLQDLRGRGGAEPLTLAIRDVAHSQEWATQLSTLGQRLGKRCWPGALTLEVGEGTESGRLRDLSDAVRARVAPEGRVRLRAPRHLASLSLLYLIDEPVLLASTPFSTEADTTTVAEVVQKLGDAVELAIEDGPKPQAKHSTVVRVEGGAWNIVREGLLTAETLSRQTACLIVFVCTGNTCRSPMAEALFKMRLAQRLGCDVGELPQRGFLVASAGVSAMVGEQAAREAVAVARDLGADLSQHVSQPLSPQLAAQADYLLAMTQSHRAAMLHTFTRLGTPPRLLSLRDEDIADPVGSSQEVYRQCAEQILESLERIVTEVAER